MGAIQKPTPPMGSYKVETRGESFYLTAPKDRLTNAADTWRILRQDVPCVLAALDQVVGPPHEGYAAWEANGRTNTGDVPAVDGTYPAAADGERVALSGPAWLIDRTDDASAWNSIELTYDAVLPIRAALQAVAQGGDA
ncbi:hypothetical protein ACFSKW_12125 [Nonomuraea mangrovi]|uniref:Uncharacterized protein n=1 Tax=Nonomuraea mangrovi TaxID=2316207 RepID=A0ABW4SRW9_9ACTN